MPSSTVSGSGSDNLTQPQASHLRHRRAMASFGTGSLSLFSIFTILISLLSAATVQGFEFEAAAYDPALFRLLESRGEIIFDRRDPPPLPRAAIQRRHDNMNSSSSTSASSTPLATATPTLTAISSGTSNATASLSGSSFSPPHSTTSTALSLKPTATGTVPSATIVPSALPSPFDSSLGSNFTSQACPDFFDSFLNNATFQACVPVSLLLQNSKSFFSAARSPGLMTETLNAACAASLPMCQPLMTYLASELISNSHCGADYQKQNPLVSQAHAGFVAYQAVYQATCLKSAQTGNYCFADAIANQLNPSDSYPYYTAVGLNLPPASHPTCSECLKETMSIFAGYAKDINQPLANTYINTAKEIDVSCGAGFANTNVPVGTMTGSTNGVSKSNVASVAGAVAAFFVAVSLA
jgi:hypothetical protein